MGSLILPNFVINPFTANATIDAGKLIRAIRIGVRMLDNIIDINKFPHKIYENYQKRFRTIGLGITGLADTLAMLNLKYSSPEGREFVDNLLDDISYYAYEASCMLAQEKGAFPGFDLRMLNSGFLTKQSKDWDYIRDSIKEHGIRNAKIMSIAPTGTMSLTFGQNCSSGIEPIFSLEYDRKVKYGGQSEENAKTVTVRDYAYEKWLEVKDNPGCIVKKDIFETALNMKVEDHVEMLGVIAKHVDMSVSKTINIPTEYSFEDTKEVYKRCWELKIKGCTIFRPNEIRQGILIADNKKDSKEKAPKNKEIEIPWGTVLDTADDLVGYKRKITNGCGKFHLHLYFDENDGAPRETFIDMGRGGGCERNLAFISKLMSISLRAGVPLEEIIDAAKTIRPCKAFCDNKNSSKGTSCPSAIGWALEDLEKKIKAMCFDDDEEAEVESPQKVETPVLETEKTPTVSEEKVSKSDDSMKCPDCGAALNAVGGCIVCPECGWNRCGE